jgi:hypothetical protein
MILIKSKIFKEQLYYRITDKKQELQGNRFILFPCSSAGQSVK